MMSSLEIAISVRNLSKMFKVYSKPSDMFWEMVSQKPKYTPFWALRNITFDVPRGSVVGLLGRNGAGKSTLLKIISGTLDITDGDLEVKGRISSILELGTGFNPENTGRENIYLGGLMVGMTREEIASKIDWIIEFSELERFIDQQFKTYSTGMQARLTFSTAVCINPDILIIDEALSVGDAKFARKSFGKIEEFRRAGHTILLVSHDINTISNFCDHAILLENGQIYEQGKPYQVSQIYYQLLFGTPEDQKKTAVESPALTAENSTAEPTGVEQEIRAAAVSENNDLEPQVVPTERTVDAVSMNEDQDNLDRLTNGQLKALALRTLNLEQPYDQGNTHHHRIGNKKAEILDYGILDEDGRKVNLLITGNKYRFFSKVLFYEDVRGATSGFVIRNIKGVDVFGTSSLVQKLPTITAKRGALVEAVCDVTMWLTNGIFFLSVAVADPYATSDVQYDLIYDAFQFEIRMKEGLFTISQVNLDAQPIQRNILMGTAELRPLEKEILALI